MSITSDIIRGHTEAIILSHLMEGDSYGYQINKDILEKTDSRYELKGSHPVHRFSKAGAGRLYYRLLGKPENGSQTEILLYHPGGEGRLLRLQAGLGRSQRAH